MSRASASVNLFTRLLGGRQLGRSLRWFDAAALQYAGLSDEAVLTVARAVIETPKAGMRGGSVNTLSLGRLAGYEVEKADAEALALAAEVFHRFPPKKLAPGVRLYREQVTAAVHLVRGALVQMDTGEGKTFALLAAAIALLRRHEKVYIVTANPYLAWRDANEAASLWSPLGVRVGLALRSEYAIEGWPGWDATVVYTTVDALAAASLRDDRSASRPSAAIQWAAVLLDEADAILLEQIARDFQLSRSMTADTKDWSEACNIALQLEARHVTQDFKADSLAALLTRAGEEEVIRLVGRPLDGVFRLLLFRDVELAYAGVRLASAGHHYEVVDGIVVPMDTASGWRTPGTVPEWAAPLEQHLGVVQRASTQIIHVVDGVSVLRRFAHVAGASGTVVDEAIEYALLLGLPTVSVRPRTTRYDGRLADLYFATFAGIEQHITSVVEEHAPHRPVLVATSSTSEAQRLAAALAGVVPEGVAVRFASGESILKERLFEDAGRPGVVIVSTRTAGRGVDIQLDAAARANGGTVLVVVGHATDARLDRQLLGRVGRNGDPYIAWFVNHPSDAMMKIATIKALGQFWDRLGLDEMGGMTNPPADRAVAAAQRVQRSRSLQKFSATIQRSDVDAGLYEVLRSWLQLLQAAGTTRHVGRPFLDAVVSAVVANRLPGLGAAPLSQIQAETVAARVVGLTGKPEQEAALRVRLTGQLADAAREVLGKSLTQELKSAVLANEAADTRREEEHARGHEAVLDLGLLRLLRVAISGLCSRVEGAPRPLATDLMEPPPEAPSEPASTGLRRHFPELSQPSAAPTVAELSARSDLELREDGALQAMVSIVGGWSSEEDDPAAGDLTALAAVIVRAETVRRPRAATHAVALQLPNRPTRSIALETVFAAAQLLTAARSRIYWQLSHRQLSALRYQHAYAAALDDLRREVEAHLVEDLYRNLRTGADPGALDELFSPSEHAVTNLAPKLLVGWPLTPPPPVREQVPRAALERDGLIEYFVAALRARLGRRAPAPEDLLPALNAVLDESPLMTLSDQVRVGEALERWRRHGVRQRLLPWRRRRIDRCVRDFLAFLHDRGLAARPSTRLQRSKAVLRRAVDRLAAPRLGVALGAFVLACAVGLLLAALPARPAPSLSPGLRLADQVLAAGALGAGLALGAALMATTGSAVVSWLFFGETVERGGPPLERLVYAVLALAACLSLVQPWQGGLGWAVVPQSLWLLALLVGALLFRNAVWLLENLGQIRATAGLVAAFITFAAVPHLAERAGASSPIAVALISGAAQLATGPLRRAALSVSTLQMPASDRERASVAPTRRILAAQLRWPTHLYALAAAWVTGGLIQGEGRTTLVITALEVIVYLLVLALFAHRLSISVTRPENWTELLRRAQQLYRPTPAHPTMEAGLVGVRRRLFAGEVLLGVALVATALVVTSGNGQIPADRMPIALIALVLGIAAMELGRLLLQSVATTLFEGAMPVSGEPEDDLAGGLAADVADVIRRVGQRLGVVLLAFLALKGFADLLGIWEALTVLWRWIGQVVQPSVQ